MTDALALLVPALALALLRFVWQGALVGLLAWLALALLRNARPQARYAVACLALLACVLLPAWTLLQALAGDATPATGLALVAGDIGVAQPLAQSGVLRALPAPPPDALSWIVALWASGAGLLSLRLSCGLLWVRRLYRDAHAEAGHRWQACVDRLAPRLGIGRKVALGLVDAGDSPVAVGWWRPLVLLPVAVVARLPAELVEALVAHELAHIRRHDYVANLLQGVAEALLFYHPVVWWLSRRIRVERELVADDLAVAALGEPRRLALALSELDRLSASRYPFPDPLPPPHYAPAAHGGHLMSRIQQLVRPQRRAIGGVVVLPLLGLAIAGAAFYAHARIASRDAATATDASTPVAAVQARTAIAAKSAVRVVAAAPIAAAQASPAAAAKPAAQAGPATTVQVQAPVRAAAADGDRDRIRYALVRKDREDMAMSGDMDDIEQIKAARRGIDGDFIWFHRDGKAWVVRDADTVARARQAWAGTDALGKQMQGLEARMQPHSERMQALGKQMQALQRPNAFDAPDVRAASAGMRALGERMRALGAEQAEIGLRMAAADDAQRNGLQRRQDALERQQAALQQEMQRYEATMDAAGKRMEAQAAPMEAIGREMEAASKPMEAIGEDMEALGARIEREARVADAQVRKLIDDAYRDGRAQPAPTQQ